MRLGVGEGVGVGVSRIMVAEGVGLGASEGDGSGLGVAEGVGGAVAVAVLIGVGVIAARSGTSPKAPRMNAKATTARPITLMAQTRATRRPSARQCCGFTEAAS